MLSAQAAALGEDAATVRALTKRFHGVIFARRGCGNGDRDSWIRGLPALEQTKPAKLKEEDLNRPTNFHRKRFLQKKLCVMLLIFFISCERRIWSKVVTDGILNVREFF